MTKDVELYFIRHAEERACSRLEARNNATWSPKHELIGAATPPMQGRVRDAPERFKHARDVGPYLGLTPTRYQSGEMDRQGRISKCGDTFTRTCLYEAANVLLTKVKRFSPLKAWGMRLAKRIDAHKARVAVARKIAVILQCIWTEGTEFWWTREEAKAA